MNQIKKNFQKLISLWAIIIILTTSSGNVKAALPVEISSSEKFTAAAETQDAAIYLRSTDDSKIEFTFSAGSFSLSPYSHNGDALTSLSVRGMVNSQSKGAPSLPVKSTLIAIPPGATYQLSIKPYVATTLDGFYRIAPAAQPAPLDEDLTPGKYAPVPFSTIENLDRWFPEEPLLIIEDAWIRTQRVLRVEYSPFQYNPARGELRWIGQIDAAILLGPHDSAAMEQAPADNGVSVPGNSILNAAQVLEWQSTALGLNLQSNKGEAYPGQHAGVPALRISITADGLYRLSYADLSASGFDVALNPFNYHFYNQGRPVSFLVEGDVDSTFEPGESLLFYGQKFEGGYLDSVYSSQMLNWFMLCPACRLKGVFEKYATENVYWLTAESTPGNLMTNPPAGPLGTATVPTRYLETARAEKQEEWWSYHFTNEDSFFYTPRLQPTVTTTYTYDISLSSIDSAAPAAVVRGSMAWRNNLLGHTTTYFFNDPSSGAFTSSVYDGTGRSYFTGEVDASNLIEGINTLQVRLEKNLAGAEYGYFDYFEVDYWRAFTAVNDQLQFKWSSNGAYQFEVTGLSSSNGYVLDITDPVAPVYLTDVSFVDGQVTFEQLLSSPARFGIFGQGAIVAPPEFRYVQPADLNSAGGADYVMVTHQDLWSDTMVLADYRESQGMVVKVVDIADLYDQHNYGIRHPIAIRNYLERTLADWTIKPEYALLVGDGHFNLVNSPRYPPTPTPIPPNPMPPNLAFVDPWQGEVDSSSLLAMIVGNDRIPDIHIGRIPAATPERLQAVIAKTIAYEQSPVEAWQRHYLFMNDNVPDPAGPFDESAQWLSDQVDSGQGTTTSILDGNDLCGPPGGPSCAAARYAFTSTLTTQGALMATYIGHGAPLSWASEFMGGSGMVVGMHNTRLPVILSLTCLDGFWFHPTTQRSLAEYFLIQPNGGAVATISPTGLGVGTGHDLFAQGLFQAMFQQGEWRLGALVDAGRTHLINLVASPDLVLTFTVFGDPALRLKSPFSMNAAMANPTGAADPGSTYTFLINIENTAAVAQSFRGALENLPWLSQFQPALLTIPAGETGLMELRVTVPVDALRGTEMNFSIQVNSAKDSELSKVLPAKLQVQYLRLFMPATLRP